MCFYAEGAPGRGPLFLALTPASVFTVANQTLTVRLCPAHALKYPLDILFDMIFDVVLAAMISLSGPHSADPWRVELLEFAGASAEKLPLDPHIRNRSVAMLDVVDALLALGALDEAKSLGDRIPDWRRAVAHARFAEAVLKRDGKDAMSVARPSLEVATNLAAPNRVDQEWHRTDILIAMARAWVAVGEYDKAQSLVEGEQLEDYQVGVVGSEINAAQDATEAELKQQLAEHRATMQLQLMDRSQTAIRSLLNLYGRFYQDVAQREQIESTIKSGWRGVPLEIQIRTLIALGQHAVDNQDFETASRLAGEANAMVRDANFSPQWFVRLMSPVAALTHASGQEGAARQMLDECRGLFDASFQEINPVYRNRTMVALAEGYFAIGDPGEACAAYLAGFEHSAANPNGRPQMQAIVQVVCSYAIHAQSENEQVSARLRAVGEALSAPW